MIDISIVVPCYNEEAVIGLFYTETVKVFQALIDAGKIRLMEFVFVDDGSSDKTVGIFKELRKKDDRVHYVSFSRNFGKEPAILAGLNASRGKYVVIMDADLQDPPSLIPAMLETVMGGEYDCAGTRRATRKGEPPIRSAFARLFYYLMSKITDVEIVDGARDFRLMSREYVDAILTLPERNRFSKGIFPWVGFSTKWFSYDNIERKGGSSKFNFWKLMIYALDGIIAFSSKPLAAASVLGVILFLASLVFIGIIIIRYLIWGDPVTGWASTICIILFCSGLQLLTAGIMGQYLAKSYTEVKQRPHYIIREAE
ncbi:glycosyl transferase family 2 [Spirochaetia bacterium]|nr:glycosyl transferase family 2 [Spirochaetia bacterium]